MFGRIALAALALSAALSGAAAAQDAPAVYPQLIAAPPTTAPQISPKIAQDPRAILGQGAVKDAVLAPALPLAEGAGTHWLIPTAIANGGPGSRTYIWIRNLNTVDVTAEVYFFDNFTGGYSAIISDVATRAFMSYASGSGPRPVLPGQGRGVRLTVAEGSSARIDGWAVVVADRPVFLTHTTHLSVPDATGSHPDVVAWVEGDRPAIPFTCGATAGVDYICSQLSAIGRVVP